MSLHSREDCMPSRLPRHRTNEHDPVAHHSVAQGTVAHGTVAQGPCQHDSHTRTAARGITRRTRALLLCLGFAGLTLAGCATRVETNDPYAPPDDNKASNAYVELGEAYLGRNQLQRADSAFQKALKLQSSNAEAKAGLAMIYQRQGENVLADDYFNQAISSDPSFTRARNNYAAFLYSRGEYVEACRQLEIAAEDLTYDNRGQLYTNLGRCQLQLGKTSEAAKSFERAVKINPRESEAWLAVARMSHDVGDNDAAQSALSRYFRLAGTDSDSLALAVDVATARGDSRLADLYSRQLEQVMTRESGRAVIRTP
ncbi:type IV pilus biogenesis/stability protein PilW [Cobetia amphilecti]|uniref:type IV pilus biogenesis/stability protein PilW n=1 Tax=Cobetia amphilecti TaxID=1055104 RepID=UPI001CDABD57|nr:type IV pilus biogenesis/stability protein PilW [Cobetia amphilecti]UBU48212.1 type IV pilus biogenesis/stability protein PilW [Cobetia amphilecti]